MKNITNGNTIRPNQRTVYGPFNRSSNDNAIVRWDGESGSLIQNSTVIIDDDGNITGINSLDFNELNINPNPGDNSTLWYNNNDDLLYLGNNPINVNGGDVFSSINITTDNSLVRFDSISGKLIHDSGVILDDLQNITNVNSITVDTITENTLNNGVNIEEINVIDGRINLPNTIDSNTGVISFDNEHYIHNYGPTNTNLFIGKESGNFTNTGSRNTTLGQDTLFQLSSGNDNVAIGESSQLFNETGVRNVTVGNSTNFNNIAGNNNTAIGHLALESNEGSNNIGIGNGAGASFSTGNNNIAIANNGASGVSNSIFIGNSSHNDTKIYGIHQEVPIGTLLEMVVIDENNKLGSQAIPIGDVTSSAISSIDNSIPRFDGISGKIIKASNITINDNSDISGANSIDLNTVLANPGDSSTIWVNSADNKLYLGANAVSSGGDVFGPPSSTLNAIPRYSNLTGKLIKDTTGFICDDNFNLKLGDNVTNSDRTFHIQGKQNVRLFMEGDSTILPGTLENPLIALTKDGNKTYASLSLNDDGLGEGITNHFAIKLANASGFNFMEGFYVFTGGVYTNPGTGTIPNTFTTQPIKSLKCNNSDQKVKLYTGLITDLIEERTVANGVTIDSVNLKDGSINLTTAVANPGTANTVWQRTSDGKLFRGSTDLEKQGDFVGPNSSIDSTPVLYDGISGKLAKNSFPYAMTTFSTSGLAISQTPATATSVYIGSDSGNVGGISNVCIGADSGSSCSGSGNVYIGRLSGAPIAASNSEKNVSIGSSAGRGNLNGSSRNIAIGYDSQSANVLNINTVTIGTNINPIADNSLRIGSEIPLTSCFIEGIHNVVPGGTKQMMIIDNSNQLGSIPFPIYAYGGLYMEDNATNINFTGTSTDFTNRVLIGGWTGVQPVANNITNNTALGTITVSQSGDYLVTYALSYSSLANNITYSTAIYINGTTKLPGRVSRRIQTAGDVGSICGCITCTLTAGENVSLYIQNETNTSSALIQDGTFGIVKVF